MNPAIRIATPEECRAMIEALFASQGHPPHPDEIADHVGYIREGFHSDGPGYVGTVGILHFNGGVGCLSAFSIDPKTGKFRLEVE